MDLDRVSSILEGWRQEVSRPGARSKGRKRPSSPSPSRPGKATVSSATAPATSTGSAQSSGRQSTTRESRSSVQDRSNQSTLARPPPSSTEWQTPLVSWSKVASTFGLSNDRYEDFSFLMYLDIYDPFVKNYVDFNLGNEDPMIVDRLKHFSQFYEKIGSPDDVLDLVKNGLKVPFLNPPPKIFLPNNRSALKDEHKKWVISTIKEYEKMGFVSKVDYVPYCVLPLQVAVHPEKLSLIHDESALNVYVEKSKFKLEGWTKMFEYSRTSSYAIKFDLKKFYYHVAIHEDYKKYFGFSYQMDENSEQSFFVWNVMPYGYTRAPIIARNLLKPLITHWRKMRILICVVFDDGMAVSHDQKMLKKYSLQIQCDLIRAGLFPGFQKCQWKPVQKLIWLGLEWNFKIRSLSISERRIGELYENLQFLLNSWPNVTYRDVSKIVGRLNSMHPVLDGKEQLYSRFLQTCINIRHFNNYPWDKVIELSFAKLFDLAKDELLFWKSNLRMENSRNFEEKRSTTLGWVDASATAIGGIVLKMNYDFCEKIFCIDDTLKHVEQNDSVKKLHVDFVYSALKDLRTQKKYEKLEDFGFFHRMLFEQEKVLDSNERELKAALETVYGCERFISGSVLTLHVDNLNAAKILKVGSSKPRLHKYALEMSKFCTKNEIILNTVAIPRSINFVADGLSRCVDNEDYGVTKEFFDYVQHVCNLHCNFDRFANNLNSKLPLFNSLSYCVGTSGVNSFNYDWGPPFVNWLFPPPNLIMKTVNKLRNCNGIGILVSPEWKSCSFYPFLMNLKAKNATVWSFKGSNLFEAGSDPSSHFGPNFNAAVNVWKIDFT